MATYLVVPDDYAGWNPTGRNFALVAAAGGAISLLAWLSLHGHLGSAHPSAASDQLLLDALVWLGAGCFCLMAIAVFGSISLSLRSRGSVSVTPEGIARSLRSRTQFLPWSDIQGLVPMPYGGVTLVSPAGKSDLVIPRFLDDYRACIAEIKSHGVHAIPPSSLNHKQKRSWPEIITNFLIIYCFITATQNHHSHATLFISFAATVALLAWLFHEESAKALPTSSRWLSALVLTLMIGYMLLRIVHHW